MHVYTSRDWALVRVTPGQRLDKITSLAQLKELVERQRAGLEATEKALDRLAKATNTANPLPSSRMGSARK